MKRFLTFEKRMAGTTGNVALNRLLSVAAAIVNPAGAPIGAINIAVSRARFTPQEAEERLAPLVVDAASSISTIGRPVPPRKIAPR